MTEDAAEFLQRFRQFLHIVQAGVHLLKRDVQLLQRIGDLRDHDRCADEHDENDDSQNRTGDLCEAQLLAQKHELLIDHRVLLMLLRDDRIRRIFGLERCHFKRVDRFHIRV